MANNPRPGSLLLDERPTYATRIPPQIGADLDLLLPGSDRRDTQRWRFAILISLLAHLGIFVFVSQIRIFVHHRQPPPQVVRRVTPLYLPPDLLTQKTPHKGEVSKTFDLADLIAPQQNRRRVVAPPKGSTRRLELPKQKIEVKAPTPAAISAEPPRQIVQNEPARGTPDSVIAALPPPPAPAQNPTPPAGDDELKPKALAKIAPPKNSLDDVLRQMAHRDGDSSQMVVSDLGSPQTPPPAPGQKAAPAKMGSEVKLQTDPQGADFRPYLANILAIVRRNWFSVLPDSARMGALRGETTIQFVINRDGSIPKLVIADSAGLQPLDRAAVAGLSMSNPLPPLPADFKGGFVRLQFAFTYNMPAH
jgi:TonB family protein